MVFIARADWFCAAAKQFQINKKICAPQKQIGLRPLLAAVLRLL